VLRLGAAIKEFIVSPSNIHVKNDKMYGSTWCNIVVDLFAKGWKVKKNENGICSLWHMLKLRHLMVDFEAFKLFSIFEGQKPFAITLVKLYGVNHGQTLVQHSFS
jgi:hypothetical protein